MIDDMINKIIIEVRETEEEFIFSIIIPWCEEKLHRTISKSDLVNALSQYFKPKTNFDKWLIEHPFKSHFQKQMYICSYYMDCVGCPFEHMDCCSYDSKEVQRWFESEVDNDK